MKVLSCCFFYYRFFTVLGTKLSSLGTVDIGFSDTQVSAILAHDIHWETDTSDPHRKPPASRQGYP